MGFSHYHRIEPYLGEVESGDGLVIQQSDKDLLVVIIDVLGHGSKAAKLARKMENFIEGNLTFDLLWLMTKLHKKFLEYQGAAVTMVYFNGETKKIKGVGVGNTLVRKCGMPWQSFHSQPGIVGELLPTLRCFEGRFVSGDVFLFTTDGIKENIDAHECESVQYQSLQSFSNYLFDNFSKQYDDSTVIVVRYDDE
ncbi:serine/threonine protein phosphatase [Vibrio sp. T187]|uniref:SpoIIE family protein phosphatase n=1 Tax=Vibrio TaxID=662 RepID=UPI0010CA1806|nr:MULTISPECIES: SpoIIE family protein phosphatase [Vibrio]MBW3695020.1 serine/threonine protein phosphatase [Vibrio sp. T187]